jgi:hypothetical protein
MHTLRSPSRNTLRHSFQAAVSGTSETSNLESGGRVSHVSPQLALALALSSQLALALVHFKCIREQLISDATYHVLLKQSVG